MEKIKVSIIIPVYNNSIYLRDCLNSVLKQTLDNIEIIAIDDSSTDDSFDILKEYQSKYQEKLKIIRNNVKHSPKDIDEAMYKLFADTLNTVWGECMEMTFYYKKKNYGIVKSGQEKNCFPIPTGVKANFVEVK